MSKVVVFSSFSLVASAVMVDFVGGEDLDCDESQRWGTQSSRS